MRLTKQLTSPKGFLLYNLREMIKNRRSYLFILPSMILFSIFIFIPVLWTIYVSFFNWKFRGGSTFIGLNNYIKLWSDSIFLGALQNTINFTISITVLSVIFGFIAALLVNDLRGLAKYFVRAAIFIPTGTSLVVTALIWRSFLEPGGIVQSGLEKIGIVTSPWLSNPSLSFLAVILVSAWQRIGYNMVFFLAGLQTIPQVFYEAAEVDGASRFAKFRSITIPLLQRTTLFVLVINTIFTFLMFDQVFMMTGGGPADATINAMIENYNQAFTYLHYGYAAAMAVAFSLITFAVAGIQMYLLRSEAEY